MFTHYSLHLNALTSICIINYYCIVKPGFVAHITTIKGGAVRRLIVRLNPGAVLNIDANNNNKFWSIFLYSPSGRCFSTFRGGCDGGKLLFTPRFRGTKQFLFITASTSIRCYLKGGRMTTTHLPASLEDCLNFSASRVQFLFFFLLSYVNCRLIFNEDDVCFGSASTILLYSYRGVTQALPCKILGLIKVKSGQQTFTTATAAKFFCIKNHTMTNDQLETNRNDRLNKNKQTIEFK